MRHEFSKAVDGGRTCTCHQLSRELLLQEEVTQQEQLPLVGLGEIASAAGVQKPVVAMWRIRDMGFPQPVGKVGPSFVWWWPDVKTWLEATGRDTDAGWTREQILASPSRVRGDEQFVQIVREVRRLEGKRSS